MSKVSIHMLMVRKQEHIDVLGLIQDRGLINTNIRYKKILFREIRDEWR